MIPPDRYYDKIKAESKRRGIDRVVHFTQSRKLAQILRNADGIKSSASLRIGASDVFNPNDQLRLDNHSDYISCSIQHPNFWMLRTMRRRERFFEDWAILLIKPEVLWQRGTLFCPRNAAAQGGRGLLEGFAAFEAMYAPAVPGAYNTTRTRTPNMLSCAPTDDQAEVMIRDAIPLAQIEAVAVPSEAQGELEIARLQAIGPLPPVRWVVAPDLFSDRVSRLVRDGIAPREFEVVYSAAKEESGV